MIDHALRIIICATGAWAIGWYMNLPWHGILFAFIVLLALALILAESVDKWWWT